MYSMLPGEKVLIERRISVSVFALATVLLLIYSLFTTFGFLFQSDHRGFLSSLAVLAVLIPLWIRFYRRTLMVVTDRRVILTIDLFAVALSKCIPIEKILGVTRIDLPFIKALFKRNLGFLFFTTGNVLTMIIFPLLVDPEEVEETFHRLRLAHRPEEPAQAPAPPTAEKTAGLVCPECGTESTDDTKFCKKCGTKIA